MSGFAAIIDLDSRPIDESLLTQFAECLAPRGPDGTHIMRQSGAAFVFTFLRTGPAPQSTQPCFPDECIGLVGDVRLDDRDALRRKLEQHCINLEPDPTDEELILRSYSLLGDEAFSILFGDFAFILWDSVTRKMIAARDPLGIKPFYYAQIGNRLYVSNALEALRLIPELSDTPDRLFIADFLLQEWCADPQRTAFKDICRLPPGHLLGFANGQIRILRFANLALEPELRLKHREEYLEQFRTLLDQAIAERIPNAPTAIVMSGGLDSTSIAALAVTNAQSQRSQLDLRAYTTDSRSARSALPPSIAAGSLVYGQTHSS